MKKKDNFVIFSVGVIHKGDGKSSIEIFEEYKDALLGLEEFSHIIIISWFHKNDRKDERKKLRVHPRRDKRNPLTGVFATRSPVRPNLVAHFTTRILEIRDNIIEIEKINAFEGTPVIDIKPYIPKEDAIHDVKTPTWLKRK